MELLRQENLNGKCLHNVLFLKQELEMKDFLKPCIHTFQKSYSGIFTSTLVCEFSSLIKSQHSRVLRRLMFHSQRGKTEKTLRSAEKEKNNLSKETQYKTTKYFDNTNRHIACIAKVHPWNTSLKFLSIFCYKSLSSHTSV